VALGTDLRIGCDRARQVGVEQEVLSERLGGPDAVTGGKLEDGATS
jgi:hypothetical protein